MPSLNSLVNISVTRQTRAVPQAGFGNVLILSFETSNFSANWDPTAANADAFRSYTQDSYATDFPSSLDSEVRKSLNSHFAQDRVPDKVYVGYVLAADTNAAGALDRINQAAEGAFYCVCPVGTTTAASLSGTGSAAAWVESNNRICFVQSAADTAYGARDETSGATEVGDLLANANYTRSGAWFTENADDWITAAIAGRVLPALPGSIVFGYKALGGVTKAVLSETQVTNLDAKNYNYFRDFGGQAVTFQGTMADGGFIDLIRDTDWIVSRIQESVVFRLINTDKIPYTEAGVDILISALRETLDTAVSRGVLELGYEVTKQDIVSVPLNDRAGRKFPEINVVGRYSGAVQSAAFQLTLSV